MKLPSSDRAAYYLPFTLYLVSRSFENIAFLEPWKTTISLFSNIMQVIVLLLVVVYCLIEFLGVCKPKDRLMLLLFLALTIAVTLVSKSYQLLWTCLFIFGLQKSKLKELAKITLVIALVTIAVAIFCDFLNATGHSVWFEKQGRYSLGFIHPNTFGKEIMIVVISWVTLAFDRKTLARYFGAVLIAGFMFLITKSRTSLLGLLFAVAIYRALLFYPKKNNPLLKKPICVFVLLWPLLWISLMQFYNADNLIYTSLDKLLTGRLSLPKELMVSAPVSLFGFDLSQSAEYVQANKVSTLQGTVPVDNAFCQLYIVYGPIAFYSILLILTNVIRKYMNGKPDSLVIAGILSCLIIGACETYTLDIGFNYMLIPLFYQATFKEKCNCKQKGRINGKHYNAGI